MLLGLMSDTHDNAARTRRALVLFEQRGVDRLLHMGDLTTGELVPLFDGHQVYLARGNVDAPDMIRAAIADAKATIEYDEVHHLRLDGARIGIIHGDDEARLAGMVEGGAFDLVLHGHTHRFRDERVGSTRIVNPGAVHRTAEPSVCLYETATDTLERVPLADP